MSGLWVQLRRELSAYFVSPLAYVVMVFFLAMTGYSFALVMEFFNRGPLDVSAGPAFFRTGLFWFPLLFSVPVLTMRLFAEEKRQGTIETLMTAPISDLSVVLSKFLAALVFYLLLWLPALCYVFVLRWVADDKTPLEWGTTLGSFGGVILIGSFYLSIGVFASSLTRNQIIAAVVAFALIIVAFFSGFRAFLQGSGWQQKVVEYISAFQHMDEWTRGIMDTRRIVFYLSLTAFMLFLTHKVVESRKWK